MKLKTVVALTSMIGFASILLWNFGNQVGGYMTFAEAQKTDARAHVVGTRAEERPTHYNRSDNVFTFYMKDQTGAVHKVHYSGPRPANFQNATQVVVEGKMGNRAFQARNILMKCPSKYKKRPTGADNANRRTSSQSAE